MNDLNDMVLRVSLGAGAIVFAMLVIAAGYGVIRFFGG